MTTSPHPKIIILQRCAVIIQTNIISSPSQKFKIKMKII